MVVANLFPALVLKALKLVVVAETQGAHCRNSQQSPQEGGG